MRISDWSSDVCSSDLNLRVAKRELRLHTDSSQNFLTQGVYSRNPSSGFNYGECQCNANCSSQLPRRLSLWAAATANLPNRLPASRRSPRLRPCRQSTPRLITANTHLTRSEDHGVGEGSSSTCRSRGSRDH